MDATLTLNHFLVSHNLLLTNRDPKVNTMTSSPTTSRKRTIKPEPDTITSASNSPSPETPSKKPKSNPTSKNKTPKYSPTKADAWTPELRLKLFEAYEASSQVKWDEVAKSVCPHHVDRVMADEKMGNGKNAKACREQWQRAIGKKIKAALAEQS